MKAANPEMARIRCAHCKNTHSSVQEVRECAMDHGIGRAHYEHGSAKADWEALGESWLNGEPPSLDPVDYLHKCGNLYGDEYCGEDVEFTAARVPVHIERLLDLEHTAIPFSQGQMARARAGKSVNMDYGSNIQKQKPVPEGFYFKEGVVFKVQKAVHGSGRLYAKELVPYEVDAPESLLTTGYKPPADKKFHKGTWEYRPGVYKLLNAEHKLTEEQAVELGKLYGMCVRCGRTLTKEESINRGMGDVCAGKGF